MIQGIDIQKINSLPGINSSPDELLRDGELFYIGGNLPIFSTLETMYESYCQESTELFLVTFGDTVSFGHNLEMIRQIKKNFSTRLMGRTDHLLTVSETEQAYMAGLDLLDMPTAAPGRGEKDSADLQGVVTPFSAAADIFPDWSVICSIPQNTLSPEEAENIMSELIKTRVVPLLVPARENSRWSRDETSALFGFLAEELRREQVPLKPLLPLLRLATPFTFSGRSGFFRNVMDKLKDRRHLVFSDMRRQLRTGGAEASFESAGL